MNKVHTFLDELLAPLMSEKLDAVVLGCTHYPLVKGEIASILGDEVLIFDGSLGTARETRRRLEVAGLLNDLDKSGTITYIDSSYPNDKNSDKSMLTRFGGEYLCR